MCCLEGREEKTDSDEADDMRSKKGLDQADLAPQVRQEAPQAGGGESHSKPEQGTPRSVAGNGVGTCPIPFQHRECATIALAMTAIQIGRRFGIIPRLQASSDDGPGIMTR
jgi:hypothetical protein